MSVTALTRRAFGKLVMAGVPAARFAAKQRVANRSFIGGVQFGLQPFCYHDLAMTPENRGTLVSRLVQNGMGMVELHATWVEPRFTGSGISAADARDSCARGGSAGRPTTTARSRRSSTTPASTIFTYYVNINDTYTDAEIDAVFEGAKMLGALGCVGSQGLKVSERVAPFPGKHGMFLGIHNHDNLSDPDAFATEASFVTRAWRSRLTSKRRSTRGIHGGQRRLPRVSRAAPRRVCRACTWAIGAGTTAAARHSAKATRRSSKCSG